MIFSKLSFCSTATETIDMSLHRITDYADDLTEFTNNYIEYTCKKL